MKKFYEKERKKLTKLLFAITEISRWFNEMNFHTGRGFYVF